MAAKSEDGIRAKVRKDGYQTVHFSEYPGHWIATPEMDREKALKWAKRNRNVLIGRRTKSMKELCAGFFRPDGKWVMRMREKGHTFVAKHLEVRQGHVDNYIIPEFGDREPMELSRREIDDWLIQVTSLAGKRLAGSTKNKILYTLKILFEEFKDLGIIETNPVYGLKPFSKVPVNPRGVIDRESLEKMFPPHHSALIRVWGESMWASMFLFFQDTGMRPGEILALTWRDIDLQLRFVPIRKGIESGTVDKIKGTKTDKPRPGYISVRTAQELAIWRAESLYNTDDDFVFTRNGKTPVTEAGVVNAFRLGLKKLGIDNTEWTPYWLRHSFGSYNLETLSEDELMVLMGHSSREVSRQYQHLDDTSLYKSGLSIKEKLDRARE